MGTRKDLIHIPPIPCCTLLSNLSKSNLLQKVKVIVTLGKITHQLDFISLKGRNHLHFTSPRGIVVLTFRGYLGLEQNLLLA